MLESESPLSLLPRLKTSPFAELRPCAFNMKLSSTLALLAMASATMAHFTLDSPPTRGFDEDKESDPFCGGFPNASTTRSNLFYPHAPISITSHHDSATINVYLALGVPTGSESFLALPPVTSDVKIQGMGAKCLYVNATQDLAKGSDAGADGKNATLMMEYISATHGRLYQCSDVVLTQDEKKAANGTCVGQVVFGASNGTAVENGTAPATTTNAPAASNANGALTISASLSALVIVLSLVGAALVLV